MLAQKKSTKKLGAEHSKNKTESMADWKSIGHWLNPQTWNSQMHKDRFYNTVWRKHPTQACKKRKWHYHQPI